MAGTTGQVQTMLDLCNELRNELTEAYEKAEQVQETARGTVMEERARNIVLAINNVQKRVTELRRDLM